MASSFRFRPETLVKRLRWQPGAYARDSMRVFGWLLLRAAVQAASVLLLARWLGAQGYGVFIAALAVASFFTPPASLGLAGVLVVRGARNPTQLPALARQAFRLWPLSAAIGSVLAWVAMVFSLPDKPPLWGLAALAVAEVAAPSWVELHARAAQARLHSHRFGAIQAGLPLARLLVLVPVMALAPATPANWMLAYAAASLAYAAIVPFWSSISPSLGDGSNQPSAPLAWASLLREGLPFMGGALTVRLQAEFNKPVLAGIGYGEAGALSVAQRILDLAMLPLSALQETLWPRVFASERPARRLGQTGALLLMLAMAGGLLLALCAPLLPWLLGEDYRPAADALIWLAGLPAVQLMRSLGQAALMAQRQQAGLLFVYALAAVSGVILTLLWVPGHGMIGAVWAMYGSEGLAAAVAWSSSRRIGSKLDKGSA